jgi:hypothetical protein
VALAWFTLHMFIRDNPAFYNQMMLYLHAAGLPCAKLNMSSCASAMKDRCMTKFEGNFKQMGEQHSCSFRDIVHGASQIIAPTANQDSLSLDGSSHFGAARCTTPPFHQWKPPTHPHTLSHADLTPFTCSATPAAPLRRLSRTSTHTTRVVTSTRS